MMEEALCDGKNYDDIRTRSEVCEKRFGWNLWVGGRK